MRRKIPNTHSLVIFSAAARCHSFAQAADELHLTASAVSRQVAALEQYLGVRLFARIKKRIVLNEAGQNYVRHVNRCLTDLEGHTQALMSKRKDKETLELAVLPTFAHRWLLPRLRGFLLQHPDITINLTETASPFLFSNNSCDAALHSDHQAWTDVVKIDLFDERLVPVVSPRYFDITEINEPSRLSGIPLLYKASRLDAWRHWFELAGCTEYGEAAVLDMRFDLYGMVIDAAIAGLGAGLVPHFYIGNEIARGDLAIPCGPELRHEKRYCFVYPEQKQDFPPIVALRDWLIQEKGTN